MEHSTYSDDTMVESDYCFSDSKEASWPTCAPALSSSRALARFEFEAGKGNEGTKILMVEWMDDEAGSDWIVSWEGKTTNLSAKETGEDKLVRIYFLLAPDASIPRIVHISRVGAKHPYLQTNPLPAIFPPELGTSIQAQKGVLHSIWAKKRLPVLQDEIAQEMKNGGGVGLEIALLEKKWIEENFGVISRSTPELQYVMDTISTNSPRDGSFPRMFEGLSLATEKSNIKIPTLTDTNPLDASSPHPISLKSSSVAVSSYPVFDQFEFASKNDKTKQNVQHNKQNSEFLSPNISHNRKFNLINTVDETLSLKQIAETDDGLFALKLSPRSPEMTRSPFSVNVQIV